MRCLRCGLLVVGVLVPRIATADDAQDAAIKKDRQQIEGTWRITALVINGNKAKSGDVKKLTVVNGSDGTWSVRSENKEVSQGTSSFDPTQKPKTIDFTPTEGGGKGNRYLGIYELGQNTRKLNFAPPGKERPTEFSSKPGSQHILVTFERVKTDQTKKQQQESD